MENQTEGEKVGESVGSNPLESFMVYIGMAELSDIENALVLSGSVQHYPAV